MDLLKGKRHMDVTILHLENGGCSEWAVPSRRAEARLEHEEYLGWYTITTLKQNHPRVTLAILGDTGKGKHSSSEVQIEKAQNR